MSKEQQDARDALNQGVAAFKNAQFDEAIGLFQRARQLDPSLQNASLYLATAYASQYIPGAPSEENVESGKMAVREYRAVLEVDRANLSAIDGLASILYQMAGQPFSRELFEESKSYHKKHVKLRPDDPPPYYSIGVIDWALAYRANTELRQEFNQSVGVGAQNAKNQNDEEEGNGENSERPLGLKDTDPLPEGLRIEYAREYGTLVDEGIESLKRALKLKSNYDDAMVYLNLLYRRKADMVRNSEEREELIKEADELLDKVKDIKQKRAENPAAPQPN